MIYVQPIIAGIFGLLSGSFLNVVNLRFGQWKGIVGGHSECPKCHHLLAWYDLVPVISFILLSRRCRYCSKPISWQYPIVELSAAILSYGFWLVNNPSGPMSITYTILLILFSYTLLLMSIDDFKQMEVSGELFWASIVMAALIALTGHESLIDAIWGAVVAAGPLLVLVAFSGERWMGWGDVWMAVPIGLILGLEKSILWLYFGFLGGAIVGLLLMALRVKKRQDPVPFVPFLFVSFLVVYIWGERIIGWYLR